ncbi:hypothetical protein ACLMNJ_02940 [Streptomyces seoulensis]
MSAPKGACVPAVRSGAHVYVAGQIPLTDGKLTATGRVGAEVSPERAGVVAGAGELLAGLFGAAVRPACGAVGMDILPLDAPVEIEIVLEVSGGGGR